MSRSFLAFLVFCLVLVLVSAGVVWYVGPTLAGIVFDTSRRENPYYLLQILPPAPAAADAETPSYRALFLALAAEDQGRPLWQGGSAEVMEGPALLDVGSVQVLEFDTGGDLVQMLTGSGYRALRSGAGTLDTHLVGTPEAPGALEPGTPSVLVLYRAADGDEAAGQPREPLGVPGSSGWLRLLPDYGGVVRWRTEVEPIRDTRGWNRMLLVQFADAGAARAWLQDAETITERAIAGMHVDDMLVVLLQPAGFAGR